LEAVTAPRAPGRFALRLLLGLIAAGFVIYAAWDLARRWDAEQLRVAWGFALLSLPPIVFAALIAARGWIALLERMTQRSVPRHFAMQLYMESQLARYTPGKVGLPLVRIAGAARLGVPARAVATSVLLELSAWLAMGGAVGFLTLALFGKHASDALAAMGRFAPLLVSAFVLGSILLATLDRARLPAVLRGFLKLEGRGPILPVRLLGYSLLYWAAWAVHGYLVARAVGAAHAPALGSAGLFVLAPIAGFLALAAPAGLGVREALLSVGLAPAVGAAPALSAAAISRAISLLTDVGTWLWARFLARRQQAKLELGSPGMRS
jgi:hypothetical protein